MKSLKELLQSEDLPAFEIKVETEEEEYPSLFDGHHRAGCKAEDREGDDKTELAEKVGLKQSVVSRFENLGTNPTLKSLFKLLKVLGGRIEISPLEEGEKVKAKSYLKERGHSRAC